MAADNKANIFLKPVCSVPPIFLPEFRSPSSVSAFLRRVPSRRRSAASRCRPASPTAAGVRSPTSTTCSPSRPSRTGRKVTSKWVTRQFDRIVFKSYFDFRNNEHIKSFATFDKAEGGCVAKRKHSCFPPAGMGSNPSSAQIFSLFCLVCEQCWDQTHLVLSNVHKCS